MRKLDRQEMKLLRVSVSNYKFTYPDWLAGKAWYQALYALNQPLAVYIKDTDLDPTEDNDRISDFIEFIKRRK